MTVGVLTTSFPRHAGDFAGSFVEDAVRALVDGGEEVELIAAGGGKGPVEVRDDLGPAVSLWRVDVLAGAGVPPLFYGAGAPEALEHGGAAVWLQAAAFWAGLCERLRARASRWDRLEAHWLLPCALAARAVVPAIPATFHAHSGDVALLERLPGGRALARSLIGGGADIQFASNDLLERFSRLAGARVGRVMARRTSAPVVSDPTNRSRTREALRLDRRTVLSVGRLVPVKGFDVLVRAAALASAGNEAGATVVILGDGPERERLTSMARRLNVDLRLPGFVERHEVPRWMTAADLYVQPSRRLASGRTEGLPVATLEALSLGVPVVASATGGLGELTHAPPRLRLVPADDAVALAACLVP
jgi:glycosyltransferase involved in cell wall biosynthesis